MNAEGQSVCKLEVMGRVRSTVFMVMRRSRRHVL